LLSYNLRFDRLYRRRVKFLPLKKSLSLKLLRLRMLKETIRVSKRNEMLTIKSVELDLALIIGVDFNLTALQKDNASRLRSPRVTLVNPKIIIGRNLIRIRGTRRYVPIITAAGRAI
jgi:hypothetical protein